MTTESFLDLLNDSLDFPAKSGTIDFEVSSNPPVFELLSPLEEVSNLNIKKFEK